jgi:hypothetical protein
VKINFKNKPSLLPDTIHQHITSAEQTNTFETRSYQNAMRTFYQNFMIRSTDINWDSIPGYELFNNSFGNMDISGNNFICNLHVGTE